MAAVFRSDAATIVELWGQEYDVQNARSKEMLGMQYRPIKTSIEEMGEKMIEFGLIPDKRPKN